jgi:amino acid permease
MNESESKLYRKDSKAATDGSVGTDSSVDDNEKVSGTIFSSSSNLVNTVLGTGMLSMPFVFQQLGVVQGLVMLSIAALFAILGLSLLSQAAQTLKSRDVSFNCLAHASFPQVAIVMDVALVITCFGGSVSYLIVGTFLYLLIHLAGSLMPRVTGLFNNQIWVSIGLALISPLAFLRKLDSLRYVSFLAMFCITFIVGIVVSYAILWPVGMPIEGIFFFLTM